MRGNIFVNTFCRDLSDEIQHVGHDAAEACLAFAEGSLDSLALGDVADDGHEAENFPFGSHIAVTTRLAIRCDPSLRTQVHSCSVSSPRRAGSKKTSIPTMGRPSSRVNSSPCAGISASRYKMSRGLPPDHFLGRIAEHALGPGVEDRDKAVRVGGNDAHLSGPIENAPQAGVRISQRLFCPLPLDPQGDLVRDGFQCRDRRIGQWLAGNRVRKGCPAVSVMRFGFPLPPLKFRTVGFPQYGFKWTVNGDLRRQPEA